MALPMPDAWISVKDERPTKYTPVLAWGPGMNMAVVEFADFDHPNAKKYTHWRPLPDPPKEGE